MLGQGETSTEKNPSLMSSFLLYSMCPSCTPLPPRHHVIRQKKNPIEYPMSSPPNNSINASRIPSPAMQNVRRQQIKPIQQYLMPPPPPTPPTAVTPPELPHQPRASEVPRGQEHGSDEAEHEQSRSDSRELEVFARVGPVPRPQTADAPQGGDDQRPVSSWRRKRLKKVQN